MTPGDDDVSRLSLRTLLVIVLCFCIVLAISRAICLREVAKKRWRELCHEISKSPEKMREEVTKFRSLHEFVMPSNDFMRQEFVAQRGEYTGRLGLQRLRGSEFINSLKDFEWMVSELQLRDGSDKRTRLDLVRGGFPGSYVVINSFKAIEYNLDNYPIASPEDSEARLNKLIDDLLLLKSELPFLLLWAKRNPNENTTWAKMFSQKEVDVIDMIKPALWPIIKHDTKMLLNDKLSSANNLSNAQIAAYRRRLRKLNRLSDNLLTFSREAFDGSQR